MKNDYELAMFRIIQEALNNVYKHAGSGKAWVDVTAIDDRIAISIRDEGKGFTVAKTIRELSPKQKFGLLSMRERAEMLETSVNISSEPGKGTLITLQVPAKGE